MQKGEIMTRDDSTIQGETGIPIDPATEPRAASPTDMALEPAEGRALGQQEHPTDEAGKQTAAETSTIQGETGIPIDTPTEPAYGTRTDRALESAREAGRRQAELGRDQAAEGLETLAGNMRRVASELQSEQPAIADAANSLADQTERLAGYLRGTDTLGILRDVETAARRQPLLFVGGAFVLGLATARILRPPRR